MIGINRGVSEIATGFREIPDLREHRPEPTEVNYGFARIPDVVINAISSGPKPHEQPCRVIS